MRKVSFARLRRSSVLAKGSLFLLSIFLSNYSTSQILGGRDNSEMMPKMAEPTELSGGTFSGDVNNMTGGFSATIPLGSVGTPSGLGFSLSLDHSSSFSFSYNRPMTAGIPYGDGWSPNLPTISVQTDVLRKFSCTQMGKEGQIGPNGIILNDFNDTQSEGSNEFTAEDEGDLYWFAPEVNIPGVASGRAVFKYIDASDDNCLVFVLNKFETPVELRYYGNKWVVIIADGTRYTFGTHLRNYRAPSNQRVLYYDQGAGNINSPSNVQKTVIDNNDYGTHGESVQNVIEPKETYSVWHCDLISNQNAPLQGIVFEYEKFGKVNFYEEFNQSGYEDVRSDVFNTSTNTDYSTYSDVHLERIYSYVMETPVDILEMEYRTETAFLDNDNMLDFNGSSGFVSRQDSLYSMERIYEWNSGDTDASNDIDQWRRYKHAAVNGTGCSSPSNPYLWSDGYHFDELNNPSNAINFSHGYLETERLFEGQNPHAGDRYEIRTKIIRPSGTDLDNNGTLDIAVVTGTTPGSNLGYIPSTSPESEQEHDYNKRHEVFSTFNSGVKWQMEYGQSTLETSNSFVMPSIPSTFDGMHIQVGPGNSDIDFSANTDVNTNMYNPSNANMLDARYAYPSNDTETGRTIASAANIPHNFGTGHPWSMMVPVYNQIAGNSGITGTATTPEDLYGKWWATTAQQQAGRENVPTKFEDVQLEQLELIRYTKNPYMLAGVKTYKMNGVYAGMDSDNTTGKKLVSQKRLEYETKTDQVIRNLNYGEGGQLAIEPAYQRKVILLSKVRELPVDAQDIYADDYSVADESKILTTFIGYDNILESTVPITDLTYSGLKPYQGINQYLITSFVDHLGGITRVEYDAFDFDQLGSRISKNYSWNGCNPTLSPQPFGPGDVYTGHAAVRYIAKNDQSDALLSATHLDGTEPRAVEYKYENPIFNPKQFNLPTPNFRSQYVFHNDVAFGKVTIYSPALETGERNYTVHEYYGKSTTNIDDIPTIEEYLYYGKPKSIRNYDHNDILHDEKIINYEHTLAFVNGYDRPNPVREQLGYDDLITRAYEYEDIHKNEPLHIYVTQPIFGQDAQGNTIQTGTDVLIDETGTAAYPYLDIPYLNGNYTDRELPKFLEFKFYEELIADSRNRDYYFQSYFVKKASEINRTYEDFLSKQSTTSNPTPPVIVDKNPNPFGGGFVNQVIYDPVTDDPLIAVINSGDLDQSISDLLAASPVSDAVLERFLDTYRSKDIGVLTAQGGLSDAIWEKIVNGRNDYQTHEIQTVLLSQSYLSDETLLHLIGKLGARDNYDHVQNMLLKNPYLSEQVVVELAGATVVPSEVFAAVMKEQSQLSESTLVTVANSSNLHTVHTVGVFEQQILSDAVFNALIARSDVDTETMTRLIESTRAFPSDNVLIEIMNQTTTKKIYISRKDTKGTLTTAPLYSDRQIKRMFSALNRPISEQVSNVLSLNFPSIAPTILSKPFTGNALSQYCNNPVFTSRNYIETRTEYEYFEADYTGKAIGKGYEMLLGHRSLRTENSPYPFTAIIPNSTTGQTLSTNVEALYLKHEPSWQVAAVKTYSPHLPGAYSEEEYYYLYDLQNRYDRYWFNYDLESGNYEVRVYNQNNPTMSIDLIGYNTTWEADYSDPSHPKLPKYDGMERSRTYGNRVFAFQKTTASKNTRDSEPKRISEYYDYDSRWTFADLPEGIETIGYDGVPCDPIPSPQEECEGDLFECTDCYWFKYISEEHMQTLVPLGHCAFSSPTLGWFICPVGVAHEDFIADATLQYCNTGTGVSEAESPLVNPLVVATPKALPLVDALSKTLLLRDVTIQIDNKNHAATNTFVQHRFDSKNEYIAEFKMGLPTDVDENNFYAPYQMLYPYDHLTVRTILERNRYLQVALEENQVGLQTKYYYDKSTAQWNINNNCTDPALTYNYNYASFENTNIAQPVRITVGYNKSDSLSSRYEYTDIGLVEKVTEPSGKYLSFEYDNYHRMTKGKENTRTLSDIEYFNWEHDFSQSFNDRLEENYVQTKTYNNDGGDVPLNIETRKAFIDPLGRNHSVATGYSLGDFSHIEVHSGKVLYDHWDRTVRAYKNHRLDVASTTVGAPKINPVNVTNVPYAETNFEHTPKARALRTSNYGVDVNGIHAVKTTYHLTNHTYTSCELDLSVDELPLILGIGNHTNFRFYRTEILDQDNKRSVEYANALGQKVATLKYNGNQRIVTLFVYDSYGNLTKVINPEKQESDYIYNRLGQLVKETTVDAGTKRYMYNKQGLVSVTLDEQGRLYDPNGEGQAGVPQEGTTTPFYRVFKYDDFGRVLQVGRSEGPVYPHNGLYLPLHYQTAFVGEEIGTAENYETTADAHYFNYEFSDAMTQDWLATYQVWALGQVSPSLPPAYHAMTIENLDNDFFPSMLEKAYSYGSDVTTNSIGKPIMTLSYNNNGMAIQRRTFTYDAYDNLTSEVVDFNPDQDVTAPGVTNVTSVITYDDYNYRKSLKAQSVDVDNDGVVDFKCFMEYDPLNRLVAIYGASGDVAQASDATLLITYEHDDANGVIAKKTHFIEENGVTALANEISYSYDMRDRLTNIRAEKQGFVDPLMDYSLYYDDQNPMYIDGNVAQVVQSSSNWNGNINGTVMRYSLSGNAIAANIPDFDKPTLYGYLYDDVNRMTYADGHVGDLIVEGGAGSLADQIGNVALNYDRIGNIKSLHRTTRNGDISAGAPFTKVQHFNYGYSAGNNRLMHATGVNGTASRSYTYDANGNLLTDNSKGLEKTIYGRAAYPFTLKTQTAENLVQDIDYLYSETDQRIYKKVREQDNTDAVQITEDYYLMTTTGQTIAIMHTQAGNTAWEYYASGSERECRLVPLDNSTDFNKDEVTFFLYDHLGNTRITYTPAGTQTITNHLGQTQLVTVDEIKNVVDYFPYGKVLREYEGNERYLSTQHERDRETGLDYRGARYYDSDMGRFLSLDPHARDYPSLSDYCYVAGNPLIYIDPDGKDIYRVNRKGKIKLVEKVEGSEKDYLVAANRDKKIKYSEEDGSILTRNIEVDKGILSSKRDVFDRKGKNVGLRIDFEKNEEMANKVFEFLAQNTQVEWSLVTTKYKDVYSNNVLFTSYKSEEEFVGSSYAKKLAENLKGSEAELIHHHNHPGALTDAEITGGPSSADIKFRDELLGIHEKSKFFIFHQGKSREYTKTKEE